MPELTQHQQQDKRYIENSGHWPRWPVVPVKRYVKGDMECGILFDVQPIGEPFHKSHESLRTVILVNMWALGGDDGERLLREAKKKTYSSIDEMLLDGWMVD